jgi:uroporphyrinogen-III synthase
LTDDSSATVVVTRPARDAEGLCRALQARRWRVIRSPAFELIAEPVEQRRAALASLDGCDLAIVTSPFAAALVVADASPSPSKPLFITPGRGTGSVLEAARMSVRHPDRGGTSEDVLAMPALQQVHGRRVAIVGAPGGRRLLDRALLERDAEVSRIDLYRRQPLPVPDALQVALARQQPLFVTISSSYAFSHITATLPKGPRGAWLRSTFIVSSPRLARTCRERGARDVHEAGAASDEAMLRALERLA